MVQVTSQRKAFHSTYLLPLILAAHVILGVIYTMAVPLWEGYDEWAHYRYMRHVVSQHALPPPGLAIVTEYGMPDESFQPPLYYVLGALLTGWIRADGGLKPVVNPHAFTGMGDGGVNVAVHDPEQEGFPYRGTVLAVHAARLMSVLLGTLAVWATCLVGKVVFPDRDDLPLAGSALAAFMPQFLFTGSIVNNDIMAITISAFALWFAVRIAAHGAHAPDLAGVLVCLGAGVMIKHTTVAVLPTALAALFIAAVRQARSQGPAPALLRTGGALALLVIAIFAFILLVPSLSTLMTYFEPIQDHIRAAGGSLFDWEKMPWHLPLDAWRYGFQTFWASFGWGNVAAAGWVYWAFAVLSAVTAFGLIRFILSSAPVENKLLMGLLVLHAVSAIIVPAYREALLDRTLLKGRYILIALPAISLLIVLGVSQWPPRRLRPMFLTMLCLAMFILATVTPFCYIRPAYARPPTLTAAEIDSISNPLGWALGDTAELLGYDVGTARVRAGQAIAVTLYWRARGGTDRNDTVGVKIIGSDYQEYGGLHTYPGRGNFATSLWKRGDTFRETYWIPVSATAPAPCLGQIRVTLFGWDPEQGPMVMADTADNPKDRSIVFGSINIRPAQRTKMLIPNPLDVNLGDDVTLLGYDLQTASTRDGIDFLTLYWNAANRLDTDYTVFIHLLDASGNIVAQWDGPPRRGTYPTTAWDIGETVIDTHEIDIPGSVTGTMELALGMYRTDTMERLPVHDQNGVPQPDGQVLIRIE